MRGAERLRRVARRAYYSRRGVRELAALGRLPLLRREGPDLAHLAFYEEIAEGPVQRDEALFLHALIRVVRPQTVVELGFLRGHSTFNFLRALDPGARVYSFDIDPACEDFARERFSHDPRLTYRTKSQDELTPGDVDGRSAEFVFIDAAHELSLNQATFERLLPLLAPDAIVAIHDTGTVPRRFVAPDHFTQGIPQRWVGDAVEHQPDERAFVNWILAAHPEFAQLHLHSRHALRWGLTLLQRSAPLPRPAGI
ncbi:MAG TPA: class I SAM-dependent methyltransferase [Thermoleophilaceae bacterium]|jgi:predicted O-methyltransferase YrrM